MSSTNLFQSPRFLRFLIPQPNFPNHSPKFSSPKLQRSIFNSYIIRQNPLLSNPNPNLNFEFRAGNDDACGGLKVNVDDLLGSDEFESPVEISMCRTLEPSLTLRHGVERLRGEIENLKLDPLCSLSGVLRFQVAVPPSAKALDWLCYQQKSSRVFPQFYLSGKQFHQQSNVQCSGDGIFKVSGLGSAIQFCSSSTKGFNFMARYLSIDSHLIRAYGFIGIGCSGTSSLEEQQSDSFYFFIPQIELNELENCSFLASTLVWDSSLDYTLGEAVKSLEYCFQQIVKYIPSVKMNYQDFPVDYTHEFAELNANHVQMVCVDAGVLNEVDVRDKCMQLEEFPTYQSYFRHSTGVTFRANMFASLQGTSFSIKECTNINILWASLIVEECVRLGFTYFCIAPGSRSSPLAISACRHPLTTCISCFDERSLAFHAVGYGRGSQKPAVVITSSGTAVSNLLPAVVEASQDFVPLMLLTADRPPELLDAGANQAIDQVNHFGKFLRFFFSLPPPTDLVPARMVLTTIDSAAYRSTQIPFGPVHINCPFREPLEDRPKEWMLTCLSGLDLWMSKSEPFTKYITFQSITTCHEASNEVAQVLQLIQNATKGLLVIGAIHTEDEIWSALLLTRHLCWPVVADILSGLRLRRVLSSFSDIEDCLLFIDHFDHILLSNSVKSWVQPDLVVQIGSKITSKRMGQFLEYCSPHPYILVDKHPCRHDPSHIVTHRVQSTITEFADVLLEIQVPRKPSKWNLFLNALNMMVAQEISFLIRSEPLLTEPHVAHVIGEILDGDVALFLGNSMVIRDVDTYGRGWVKATTNDIQFITKGNFQFHGIRVSGNRGASGIDGLLSTAIGFAAGCDKKVFCMIGDVSFLHDTNGLAVLNQRTRRKPITVLVINNHGGAIFSLLPIADSTPSNILNQYFYTSHDVSVRELCSAHSVKHLLVRTKSELHHALWKSQKDQDDCVIEVDSCIHDNAKFHRTISKFACQAADQTLRILKGFPFFETLDASLFPCKIQELKYSLYRIQLCAPLTSSHVKNDTNRFYREGFILSIVLDDGSVGFGEVAPIEIHKEDLSDAEEQLRFLLHVMEGSEISYLLPLIKDSFSNWIWKNLGIPPHSIFPSVRCGIEMAILNAIAARHASSLSSLMTGCSSSFHDAKADDTILGRSTGIPICALIDCSGTLKEVAHVVSQIVDEGFTTIKIKVGRRKSPVEDASVIQEIRQTVGCQINIRADANRKWTYEEAVQFGLCVKKCNLQYIEEPVCIEDDIVRFCEETGLPVALDETIDSLEGDVLDYLNKFVHPGIVAVVIKPSVVGGFENASFIAKWAQMHGKMAIVSGAFESGVGLSSYIQYAHYLEQQNETICKLQNREFIPAIAHGLGTYKWLKEDVTLNVLKFSVPPHGDTIEASIKDADTFLRNFEINHRISQWAYKGEKVRSCYLTVNDEEFSYSFRLLETGRDTNNKIVIFLHGFLGSSQDWVPLMKAVSATARCIAVDLPGHGRSLVYQHSNKNEKKIWDTSMESVADTLMKVICTITTEGVILVGYSMGARIALYMALKHSEKIDGAVIVSGSPGLKDEPTRRIRIVQDLARARCLMSHGLECFLETWYAGKLWKSLRGHPHFNKIIGNRAKHHDIHSLAKVLSDLSVGRQLPLWEDLKQCKKPLLFIAGEKDTKFKDIAQQMWDETRCSPEGENNDERRDVCEMVVIKDCGHAVHLENPLPLINAVRKFVTRVKQG